MVVICIFSVTHVAAVRNPGSPPDYSRINQDHHEDTFSSSGSGLDNGSGGGGDGANSEQNTGTSGGGSASSSVGGESGSAEAVAAASKVEEVRRNARLSYPLALAFGVSAQIGRHVRTQEPTHPSQGSQHHGGGGGHGRSHHRHGSHGGGDGGMSHGHSHQSHSHPHQHHPSPPAPVVVYGVDSKSRPSSNQPQPRPLGSRLLGPVVLFCDWLTAQPRFLRIAEDDRSGNGNSKVSTVVVRVGRVGGGVASVAVQEVRILILIHGEYQ